MDDLFAMLVMIEAGVVAVPGFVAVVVLLVVLVDIVAAVIVVAVRIDDFARYYY